METNEENQKKLDQLDDKMQALFIERMQTVKAIAQQKIKADEVVYDADHEQAIEKRLIAQCDDEEIKAYYRRFLERVLALSKEYQKDLVLRSTL
jgi:chorismate mutase